MKKLYDAISVYDAKNKELSKASKALDPLVDKEIDSLLKKKDTKALWELLSMMPRGYAKRYVIINAIRELD